MPTHRARTVIKGTVAHIVSAGLEVDIGEDRTGFVTRKELTWNLLPPHPGRDWTVGQTIETVEIGRDDRGKKLLSVRQLTADPWEQALKKYAVGDVVTGRVYALVPDVTYFQIGAGVSGRIHLDALGPSAAESPEDWVGIGDTIRAVIVGVNDEYRNFECNMRNRLNKLLCASLDPAGETAKHIESTEPLIPNAESDYFAGFLKILIIDDDGEFCIAAHQALTLAGHHVDYALQASEGIERALRDDFDVIAVDLIQPQMSGIEICERIRQGRPGANVAIFTGEGSIDANQLAALNPRPLVLRKPFDIQDLEAAALGEVRSDSLLVPEISLGHTLGDVHRVYEDHPEGPGQICTEETSSIAGRLSADSWGAFEWSDHEQRLTVLQVHGFKTKNPEHIQYDSNHSFVKNVAEVGEIVHNDSYSASSEGFKKWCASLRNWLDFESMACLPVIVKGRPRFAILASSTRSYAFSHEDIEWMKSRAEVIGARVEAWESYEQLERIQRMALRGQLTASLTHELRNRLNTLAYSLYSIKRLCDSKNDSCTFNQLEYTELLESVSHATQASERLGDIVSAFSESREERGLVLFDVSHLVETVATRLRPYAKRLDIGLDLSRVQKPLTVTSSPARLGQVFENVILNALQHTANYRSNANGRVLISARLVNDIENRQWIEVRIRDNGPGIHARDYDRIFEMGYSTRPDGLGIGLALSKATMELLGGAITIEETVIFEGTIMLVRIPTVDQED